MFFSRVRVERKSSGAKVLAPIQARLIVGPSHDPLELEADRMADQVTRDMGPGVKAATTLGEAGGQPLPENLRTEFESRFGHDFSKVRIHSDAEAASSIGAHAFTRGEDIVFGRGQYQPSTRQGLHLLAHELTHVVQQGGQALHVQRQTAEQTPAPAAAAAAPPAPAVEPTITFGANAVQADVTDYSLGVLKDILKAAKLTSAQISSTSRDPVNQARVMYDNLETHGVEHQKALYKAAGQAVIDVYDTEKKKEGSTAAKIKEAMVAKINELGATTVSRHASDPKVLNVFDVAPSSITDAAAFETAVNAEKRVSKFLKPPQDPGFHLEIPQA
jgi:hypothetical protein